MEFETLSKWYSHIFFCYPRIHPTHFFFLGVFFLFGAGRLSLCRSQPEQAIKYYSQAMSAQSQYRNLHHISNWEMAVAYLSLWDIKSSLSCWTALEKEATVNEFITPELARYLLFF
jgi:TPR repeat protein